VAHDGTAPLNAPRLELARLAPRISARISVVASSYTGIVDGPNSSEPSGNPRVDDGWLQPWLPLLRERAGQRKVLEIGCGRGRDTAVLQNAGLGVLAIDSSPGALAEARLVAPGASFVESDLRDPFPIEPSEVGAIVASLCLHYFDWRTTRQIVARLHSCLAPDRLLICRVNSVRDVHHGATGHAQLEPGYYRVGDQAKRFFSHSDLLALFADGWHLSRLEEKTIDRYQFPKVVWEFVAHAQPEASDSSREVIAR
jgi:SAM-dependent methyltransferase